MLQILQKTKIWVSLVNEIDMHLWFLIWIILQSAFQTSCCDLVLILRHYGLRICQGRSQSFRIGSDLICDPVYGLFWIGSRYPFTLKSFDQEWMLYFIKCFLCIYWEDHMVLVFLLLIWWITLIVLRVLNQPCVPGINPTWSWWIIFLMYCWILFEFNFHCNSALTQLNIVFIFSSI